MFESLGQMALIIGCGTLLRVFRPFKMSPEALRHQLTQLVFHLFFPALVLKSLWETPLGQHTLLIAMIAVICVLSTWVLAVVAYAWLKPSARVKGALILAATFPNVTYLGLPILENIYGQWARQVAITFDLFACLPLLLTLGSATAQYYGTAHTSSQQIINIFKVPALWAALIALLFNYGAIPIPALFSGALGIMAEAVTPLVLIALGLSLQWNIEDHKKIKLIVPVILLQLIAMPAIAYIATYYFGLVGEMQGAIILEAAMPSMIIGIVFCERYGLDTEIYTMALTASTVLSIFSLSILLFLL